MFVGDVGCNGDIHKTKDAKLSEVREPAQGLLTSLRYRRKTTMAR
jgi:hypothetical protein